MTPLTLGYMKMSVHFFGVEQTFHIFISTFHYIVLSLFISHRHLILLWLTISVLLSLWLYYHLIYIFFFSHKDWNLQVYGKPPYLIIYILKTIFLFPLCPYLWFLSFHPTLLSHLIDVFNQIAHLINNYFEGLVVTKFYCYTYVLFGCCCEISTFQILIFFTVILNYIEHCIFCLFEKTLYL